jgi:glycosyltransferase 2 family protein
MTASSRRRHWAVWILKLAVVVALLGWIWRGGFFQPGRFEWLTYRSAIAPVLLALAAFVLSQVMAALRLIVLLRGIDYRLSASDALSLTFVGAFFNFTLPGLVGGDVVKGYYLYRDEVHARGRSSGVVVADRLVGLAAIAVVGAVAATWLLSVSVVGRGIAGLLAAVVVVGVAAVFVMAAVVVAGRSRPVYRFAARLSRRLFRSGGIYNATRACGELSRRPMLLAAAFALSLSVQVLSLAGIASLMKVAGTSRGSTATLTAVSAVVLVAAVVPLTPGNLGYVEFLAAYGWSAAGSGAGATVFVAWRLITVVATLPGAVLYLVGPSVQARARRRASSIDVETGSAPDA